MLIYIGEISDAYYYGVYNIIKMLYPVSEITRTDKEKADLTFTFSVSKDGVTVYINGFPHTSTIISGDVSLTLKRCIYDASGKSLPFGAFTGIRPVKGLKRYGKSAFREIFLADPQKTEVTAKCAEWEDKISKKIKKRSAALYVNIPFCPTRCAYCSFTAANYSKNLADSYFNAVMYELSQTLKAFSDFNISPLCAYIGGGTPTVLTSGQLGEMCRKIKDKFPDMQEFTVEAGRPDTIDKEKMKALYENGVTRISINPQSLNENTLKKIGRRHTADDFMRAYDTAKNAGIMKINTDIIAGLPDETLLDFKHTLSEIIKLNPTDITVHTLCKKRCSDMDLSEFLPYSDTEKMLDFAYETLSEKYEPYYIYRQKNALGALENVGFIRDNNACMYNIVMMEETESVVAVGAGSASKLIGFNDKKPFSKLRDDKNPQRYISQIEEITAKKRRFLEDGADKI